MESAPALNPPRQARSRRAWARVLDVGEEILEAEGLEGFTIAAICERAGVSAGAIYARVPGKDALFLAVYQQTLDRMATERESLNELGRDGDASAAEVIRAAVRAIAGLFLRRAGFVRSVVGLSATDDEVRRRGSEWMTELGHEFRVLVRGLEGKVSLGDVDEAVDVCYRVVWSTIAMYIFQGAGYANARPVTDDEFVDELAEVAVRYLL